LAQLIVLKQENNFRQQAPLERSATIRSGGDDKLQEQMVANARDAVANEQ
jgi:hypothetical protein